MGRGSRKTQGRVGEGGKSAIRERRQGNTNRRHELFKTI